MNYIVVNPLIESNYTVDVAKWLYDRTENKPLLVQYNGIANLFSMESYATIDTIIDPIVLANTIKNDNKQKLHINRLCRVLTPYNTDIENLIAYYSNQLFTPSAEALFTKPQELLDSFRIASGIDKDLSLEKSFLNSINTIRDYAIIEEGYFNSIYLDREYDNIYLCCGSLINSKQKGLFPTSKDIDIDIVNRYKESADVYLVLDLSYLISCDIDTLNRVVDRFCLDNIDRYKYHIVIVNANKCKTFQVNHEYISFSMAHFINAIINNLYLDIESFSEFKNNQLSNVEL